MTDRKLYFGGMPTGPDVKKLNDRWPDPKIGDEFPYSEIAKIIKTDRLSSDKKTRIRFITVTKAWRKDLLKRGIVVECIKDKSLVVHNNKQIINRSFYDVGSVQRKLRRRRVKLSTIDSEDAIELASRDHAAMLCYLLERQADETKSKIMSPNVITLPQVTRDK